MKVTMWTSDREAIRHCANLLTHAANMIGDIDHRTDPVIIDEINDVITGIKQLALTLNHIDSQAITYQMPPGQERP